MDMQIDTWLLPLWQRFGVALLLGLLVGVDRERVKSSTPGIGFGGVRTFTLLSLLGCTAGLAGEMCGQWVFVGVLLSLTVLVGVAYLGGVRRGDEGMTSEVAAMLVFLVGGLVYWGCVVIATALTVAITFFLSYKRSIHTLIGRLSDEDVFATLKFALVFIIILPILPNKTYGPFDVLNPQKIWLMVVLISAVNFIGYGLTRILGPKQGIGLTGLVGGLVSSTAVTLGFSRRSQNEPQLAGLFSIAIIAASMIMFARVLVVVGAVNLSLLPAVAVPAGAGLAAGLIGIAYIWFRYGRRTVPALADSDYTKGANPLELGPAIKFGLLFGVVLFVAAAAQKYFGDVGLYVSSILAGLTDVDAITLSLCQLAGDTIDYSVAARGIIMAVAANTIVKAGMVATLAAGALRRQTIPVFSFMLVVTLIAAFAF